jgi:single-stranded-DNA-specific exonuclease
MKFRWALAPAQPLLASRLAQELHVSPLFAQCLINRGLNETAPAANYLQPRLKDMLDPFLLPGIDRAIERLLGAREKRERIAIFGDYDADGVTATAILLEVLRPLGWNVESYLPNRLDEGYGLSLEAVQNCLERHSPNLLIAVDCGSSSAASVEYLRQRGIDVIILDHHQACSPLPAALALINPHAHRPEDQSALKGGHQTAALGVHPSGCSGLFHELCSAGLAFKFAHALIKRGRETNLPGAAEFDVRHLLDLAALGTIADVVPLTGENRIIVSAGMSRLNSTNRPGLIALKRVARSAEALTTRDVGFQLAPRLNAAGRLESAEQALHLLMAKDLAEAMPLAQALDARNRERQGIERTISTEIIRSVEEKFRANDDYVIVEGKDPWHIGVVGIVAARVLQRFYRPTIIMGGGDGEEWRGSGRSIAGFDLAGGLRECDDLLVRHGGHAMAAGLTIRTSNLDAFRARLNDIARRALKSDQLQPALELDAEVGLEEMNLQSLHSLDRIKPIGQGNPSVQFHSRGLAHQRPLQRVGAEKQHVKMWLTDGTTTHEAVWWSAGNESLPVGKFDVAFTPEINRYNSRPSVQLRLLDWRPTSAEAAML